MPLPMLVAPVVRVRLMLSVAVLLQMALLLEGLRADAPPKLAVIGLPEVVWNQTRDACPGLNPYGHIGEQPDSMPLAYHSPEPNLSYLIASVNWGTYATVGPNLSAPLHHDCTHKVFASANHSDPATYSNNQWLQSVRMMGNAGVGLVHNEFHGETTGNSSLCSYNRLSADGRCQMWASDLALTTDGGRTWQLSEAPLLALPRPYAKDQPLAGYGAIGSSLLEGGYMYVHVARTSNRTGAGVCVWRTANVFDPGAYRAWNGSGWGAATVDPYTHKVPASEEARYTCANINVGAAGGMHPNPKRFAGAWRPAGWPTHVLLNWPEGQENVVSYSFPTAAGAADGPAPFTDWASQLVSLGGWMDPHTLRGEGSIMYPSLIDHDSPGQLRLAEQPTRGAAVADSDGFSYGLVGNGSLHLYVVLRRALIVRFPVAWFPANAPTPPAPFPPLPPNPPSCRMLRVEGAGLASANGNYSRQSVQTAATPVFVLDSTHHIYCMGSPCLWRIANPGHTLFYVATRGGSHASVPAEGWSAGSVDVPAMPVPTVTCADHLLYM